MSRNYFKQSYIMHINRITLINFKRFRRLTIDLPWLRSAPKLVLLVGGNGAGKSSVFDAFEWISKPVKDDVKNESTPYEDAYYVRFIEEETRLLGHLPMSVRIDFAGNESLQRTLDFVASPKNLEKFSGSSRKDLFYGRSALRQTPRITNGSRGDTEVLKGKDADRPRFYIDADERFQNDLLLWNKKLATPINAALKRIFGTDDTTSLQLTEVVPPKGTKLARIKFQKGAPVLSYDLLSSGEKEIFGVLLNLAVRRRNFQDTIYFIDELDIHLNTGLQYAFLKEIVENWIPENCQLWTASHSLGFIQYARESENAQILSFDGMDFDSPQTILPQPKENPAVYEIAVPQNMVAEIFRDKSLIFCENRDVVYYNSLGFTDRLFLPAKDKNDVYFLVKNHPKFSGLMDKDFLAPREIEMIRQKVSNLFVLDYYSIESYFYHPENLAEAIESFDVEAYKEDLRKQKRNLYRSLIYGLKQARDGYKVLAIEKIDCKKVEEEIIAALESDEFDVFYPYLDMKKKFSHKNLNVSKDRLAQTGWFRRTVSKLFELE